MDEHRRVARSIVDRMPGLGPRGSNRCFTGPDQNRLWRIRDQVIPAISADEARSLTLAIIEDLDTDDGWYTGARLLGALARKRPVFDVDDTALLFDLALRPEVPRYGRLPAAKVAATAASRLDQPVAALRDAYAQTIVVLDADTSEPADRAKVRGRLLELLRALEPEVTGAGEEAIDLSAVRVNDGWGRFLHEALDGPHPGTAALSALVNHAASLTAPRPTKTWRRRAAGVASAPGAEPLLHEALASATRCPVAEVVNQWGGRWAVRVGPDNYDILRGFVWCAMALEPRPPWLFDDLVAISVESMREHSKVMGASIAAIGETDDPAAVSTLVSFQRRTRDRGHLKVIGGALDTAAARSGMERSELLETTVPDHGLDADGRRTFVLGDLTASIVVDEHGKVTARWSRDGQELRGVPSEAKEQWPTELAEVKRVTSEVRKLVSSERARLESLIAESRSWPVATFEQRYLGHPVTAPLARGLIWWITSDDGTRLSARRADDGSGWILVDGAPLDVGVGARVAPWHPLTVEPSTVWGWRRHIESTGWRQPFKQAFREIYLLTPAEEETATYSNRFAAHILDYRQAFALMKERGWAANFLGGWSGGHEGEAKREFPDHSLRAVFFHEPVHQEGERWAEVTLCATDRVQFVTTGRGERPVVALVDVPPLVFSEAMRDVDLFVGVASMANDPTWVDRGADGHLADWDRVAFGELTATAETRRDVLEHLLPKLEIAGVTHLEGRFLEVQGHLHRYRIHLGSGNIMMEPNNRYLCIVSARKPGASALRFVPFDGDHTLSLILSKAFLLADDHKITDPSILAQINRCR